MSIVDAEPILRSFMSPVLNFNCELFAFYLLEGHTNLLQNVSPAVDTVENRLLVLSQFTDVA